MAGYGKWAKVKDFFEEVIQAQRGRRFAILNRGLITIKSSSAMRS
jgi:hypothetical protein